MKKTRKSAKPVSAEAIARLADQGKETDKHVLAVNNARIRLEEMIDGLETIVKAGVPRLCFAGNLVGGFFLDLA